MSGLALGWSKQQLAPCKASKALLVMLADYADELGFAWPKIRTIAGEAQMSERHAQRLLRSLENDGLLLGFDVVDARTGFSRPRVYWFPTTGEHPEIRQLRAFEAKVGAKVVLAPGMGDTGVTPGVTIMSPLKTLHLPSSVPSERGPCGPLGDEGRPEDPSGGDAADRGAWAAARAVLTGQGGMTKRGAGRFFGRLLGRHGLKPSDLADALAEARRLGTSDPAAWLVKAAEDAAARKAADVHGQSVDDPSTWTLGRWAIALDVAGERGSWPADWGEPPGHPDSRVPADLLPKAAQLGLIRPETPDRVRPS
jgi:hypothetical protein